MTLTICAPGNPSTTTIGWPGDAAEGAILRVTDAGLAIDAAANGFGTARVPLLLAEADIASGRVVQVGDVEPDANAYWLVAPLPQWRQKKVRELVAALTA